MNSIPPHRPAQLSPPELRQAASSILVTTVQGTPPRAASMVIDALDAAVWAMLGSLGCTPREAEYIAAMLWGPR